MPDNTIAADANWNPEDGPYLAMAVICERLLRERDNVMSVIRVIDTITREVRGPAAPEQMPPIKTDVRCVLAFKAGRNPGPHRLRLTMHGPAGEVVDMDGDTPMQFLPDVGPSAGLVFEVAISLEAEQEGLYWWDVVVNDRLVTRIPLRVVYRFVATATGTQDPEPAPLNLSGATDEA